MTLGAGPNVKDAGVTLGAGPKLNDAGVTLGAGPNVKDAGVTLGAGPNVKLPGVTFGAGPNVKLPGVMFGAGPNVKVGMVMLGGTMLITGGTMLIGPMSRHGKTICGNSTVGLLVLKSGITMSGKAGGDGIGIVKFVGVENSGTFVSILVVGVCTTVQFALTTVTIGSIFVPAA